MAYIENVRTFVRAYELGSMSAAARDLRVSAAVASARIGQLEEHLNIRLFQRTTRLLTPTEQGEIFYRGAQRILEAIEDAEAEITDVTENPKGSIYVAAPIGLGQRLLAPMIPGFCDLYPLIHVRLRLSDRRLDVMAEGLDAVFFLGQPEDSSLRIRKIADCRRVLCASPAYLDRKGAPQGSNDLATHDCLNLRFPGVPEFRWPLQAPDGLRQVKVVGPYECDQADVLTDWALQGRGIVLKPVFEVADHLAAGRLVPVLESEPPVPIQLGCLYAHRRMQDPKTRMFIDHAVEHIRARL